jgi:hypothetical protein
MSGSAHPGSGQENQGQANDFGSQNATRNAKASDAGPEAARGPNAGSRPDFERGEARTQTDDAPGHEARSFQTPEGVEQAPSEDPPEDHYDPSAVEVSRAREQGLGFGERDLVRQRDPHRPVAPAGEEDRPDGE